MIIKQYIFSHLAYILWATQVIKNRSNFDEDLDLADEDLTKILRPTMLTCEIF